MPAGKITDCGARVPKSAPVPIFARVSKRASKYRCPAWCASCSDAHPSLSKTSEHTSRIGWCSGCARRVTAMCDSLHGNVHVDSAIPRRSSDGNLNRMRNLYADIAEVLFLYFCSPEWQTDSLSGFAARMAPLRNTSANSLLSMKHGTTLPGRRKGHCRFCPVPEVCHGQLAADATLHAKPRKHWRPSRHCHPSSVPALQGGSFCSGSGFEDLKSVGARRISGAVENNGVRARLGQDERILIERRRIGA